MCQSPIHSRITLKPPPLPDRLPYQNAKVLVRSMLDSLTVALLQPEASAINRLLIQLPFAPLDDVTQSKVNSVLAIVETDLAERLASGGGGSSSSASSSRPPPPPPALPLPLASPSIDATASLAQNATRIVQSRLGRPMTTEENASITNAMMEALSILTTGGEAVHRARLGEPVLNSLAVASSAQLWASLLDAIETVGRDGSAFEVASVATALTEAVSTVVSAQLTNLIGL